LEQQLATSTVVEALRTASILTIWWKDKEMLGKDQ
jgi:hypothetical protein